MVNKKYSWIYKDKKTTIYIKNTKKIKIISGLKDISSVGNKVSMLISKSKINYLRKFFQEVKDNLKKTWTKINDILNKNVMLKIIYF